MPRKYKIYIITITNEPNTRALGRVFLASLISPLIVVAIIHPSYAKAAPNTAAAKPLPLPPIVDI